MHTYTYDIHKRICAEIFIISPFQGQLLGKREALHVTYDVFGEVNLHVMVLIMIDGESVSEEKLILVCIFVCMSAR